jgi:WS/DGAT/MGAT family acyltransferase
MGRRLTTTESFMWSLGQDPNLASTMGMVNILEAPPDQERLRRSVARLVASVERLRLKVSNPLGLGGAMGTLEWVTDDQFDLDHHLRTVRIEPTESGPPAVDGPELSHLSMLFVNDPFDRTRPLWQFQLVTGLAGGRAALLGKFHHSISDGMGMVRMGAHLLEFEPNAPAPDPVDLEAVFAADLEAEDHQRGESRWRAGAERFLEFLQDAVSDVPSPGRVLDLGGDAIASARVADLGLDFGGDSSDAVNPAPLWRQRSRNRRFASLIESLPAIRETAREHDVSVNDLFVGACAEAAVRYHHEFDIDLDQVRATVVINVQPNPTEDGDERELGDGDNAFLPVPILLPGSSITAVERLAVIRSEVKARRAMLEGKSGALSALSSLGAFVPPAVAANIVLDQAAKVDFATSNVPGSPIATWLAGQAVERMYPMGPVTGTAFNITMLSYNDRCHFGVHIDPVAVSDTELLVKSIALSLRELGVDRLD